MLNHSCFTLLQDCAVLRTQQGPGEGPIPGHMTFRRHRLCRDHVSTCTQGWDVFAGAEEAPSRHLCKHKAVVQVPGAQPKKEPLDGDNPTTRGEGWESFSFQLKAQRC